MTFFRIYQYLAPLLLFPLSWWLWWLRYGDHRQVAIVISLPVVFAYVVPALGTNWLKLWEFHTRLRLGRFRPHHGFVFGTATSLFALVALPYPMTGGIGEAARSAFVLGSVLAFWNWLYDALAIRAGFITFYNRRWHEGADPEAIALDYAPFIFGGFGACYGAAIRLLEEQFAITSPTQITWILVAACHVACLTIPVLACVTGSRLTRGEWGLHSYERSTP